MNDGSLKFYMETVTLAVKLYGRPTLDQITGVQKHLTQETSVESTVYNGARGALLDATIVNNLKIASDHGIGAKAVMKKSPLIKYKV